MSKWTLWFLIATILSLVTLGWRSYSLSTFTLDEPLLKKAALDGLIVTKLETLKFEDKLTKSVKKTLSLKQFYIDNGGKNKVTSPNAKTILPTSSGSGSAISSNISTGSGSNSTSNSTLN